MHPDTLLSLNGIGYVLNDLGRYKAAESIFRDSLAKRKVIFGEGHPMLTFAWDGLALAMMNQGQLEEALEFAEATDKLLMSNKDLVWSRTGVNPIVLEFVKTLAKVYTSVGKLEEAEHRLSKVIDGTLASLGDMHPNVQLARGTLARVYVKMATASAEENMLPRRHKSNRNLSIGGEEEDEEEEEEEEDKASVMVVSRKNEGVNVTYETTFQLESFESEEFDAHAEAEMMFRNCLDKYPKVLGPNHYETALVMCDLATLLMDSSMVLEDAPTTTATTTISSRQLDRKSSFRTKDEDDVAKGDNNTTFDAVDTDMARLEEAEKLFIDGVGRLKEKLGPDHPAYYRRAMESKSRLSTHLHQIRKQY
jgi:tetratricopeptide (TPR) repeat protein